MEHTFKIEKELKITTENAVMENKYVSFEVYRPVKSPTEKGEYMGKTPNLEQARRAADAVGGALYGITSDGRKVLLL
nr:MAG TPA: hypothetical protein [Caudoviricetes sp.]